MYNLNQNVRAALITSFLAMSAAVAVGSGGNGGGGGTIGSLDHKFSMVSTGLDAIPGTLPTCVADVKIKPDSKYPTLNQASLNVTVTSLDLPDFSSVGVYYTQTGSAQPISCPAISLVGGAGSRNIRFYLTTGASVTSVTVIDTAGRALFTGN